MTLADYLSANGITDQVFGPLIGVDRSNVYRMRTAGQIPTPDVMRAIARETGGSVTANDFFGIETARRPTPTSVEAAA